MSKEISHKAYWKKEIARQKAATNILSDRLRAARTLIEAQVDEISKLQQEVIDHKSALESLHFHHKKFEPLCQVCQDSLPDEEVGEAGPAEVLAEGKE